MDVVTFGGVRLSGAEGGLELAVVDMTSKS